MNFGNVSPVDGPIRLLLVAAADELAATGARAFDGAEGVSVAVAGDAAAALAHLEEGAVDCVVADADLGGRTGLALFEAVTALDPALPFVLITASDADERAGDAIRAGVTDYVSKTALEADPTVLAHRVGAAVTAARQSAALDRSCGWDRAIVEQSLIGLYVIRDGVVAFANDYLADLLGYDADTLVGRDLLALVVPEHRPIVAENLRLRETGTVEAMSYTVDLVRADGTPVTLEVNGRAVVHGDETVIVGAAMDVTARRESERRLRESERLTRQIIDSLPDMVFLSRPETLDVVYINSAYESLWGRDRASLYADSTSFLELVHVDDRDRLATEIAVVFADIAAGTVEERYEFEFRFVSEATGGIRWAHARAVPLFGEDESVKSVLGVMTDLTDRIARERDLARQNARLETFARVLSHDLRGPISVAQGRLDLAREHEDASHLDHVERAHDRITEVLEDVLSLARDGGTPDDGTDVVLADAAAAAWEMCVPPGGDVRCEIGDLPVVHADESRVKRLFENLFRNAVEHGSTDNRTRFGDAERGSAGRRPSSDDADDRRTAGDSPDCDADHADGRHRAVTPVGDGGHPLVIRVGALPSQDGFYVEDDGPGIPKVIRDDIFQSGFTTNAHGGGNGLGLDIVREITNAHGWAIRAAETAGGGARFEVLFDPLGDADVAE